MILIDTSVLAELGRPRPVPAVERWAAATVPPFGLSVITVEEIRFGLSWKPNTRIDSWFRRFFSERCQVFPVTEPVAHRAGELRGHFRSVGRTRTQADMLIAATAQVHRFALATRSVRDFEGCGIAVFNPFDGTRSEA